MESGSIDSISRMSKENLNTPLKKIKKMTRSLTHTTLKLSQFLLLEMLPNTKLSILNHSRKILHIQLLLNNLPQPLEALIKNGFLMYLSVFLTNADTLKSPLTSNPSLLNKIMKHNTTEAPKRPLC